MRAASCPTAADKRIAAGRYVEALHAYSSSISSQPHDAESAAKLHSNMSAAFFKLGQYGPAVQSADRVILLQPAWEKGYVRKTHALITLEQYTEAAETIEQGLNRAKGTAGLLEAKQALQDLFAIHRRRKKSKLAGEEQPASSLQAALRKLQSAGKNPFHKSALSTAHSEILPDLCSTLTKFCRTAQSTSNHSAEWFPWIWQDNLVEPHPQQSAGLQGI